MKKIKLFKDYYNEAPGRVGLPKGGTFSHGVAEQLAMRSFEWMLNDLAHQIHELSEKMDFVMENTFAKVEKSEQWSELWTLKKVYEKNKKNHKI